MFSKNYYFNWIAGRVYLKNLKHIHFNFGRGFCDSSSMVFPEAPASSGKKSTCCIVLLFVWAKKNAS